VILRVFLLVISLNISLLATNKCYDHYAPQYFEESSDELADVISEYFEQRGLSFPPTISELQKAGLQTLSPTHLQLPQSTKRYRELEFPIAKGVWRYSQASPEISVVHLLIKEPTKLSEIDAINTYNGLLGAYWNDYKVSGYEMLLEPEDSRIRYKDSYFELNVKIYGLRGDATALLVTHADLIFRDYTTKVQQYIKCMDR